MTQSPLTQHLAYVNQNPAAFSNAYFDVAWLKVYE